MNLCDDIAFKNADWKVDMEAGATFDLETIYWIPQHSTIFFPK